jgi:hypothetical protein
MSDLIWTIDDGLHEITPGEAREEAGKLLRRARYEKDPARKTRLVTRAVRLLREAEDEDWTVPEVNCHRAQSKTAPAGRSTKARPGSEASDCCGGSHLDVERNVSCMTEDRWS